jgi:hypothetical protein
VKRLDENIHILQQFKINEWYLVRKLNLKFIKSACMILYQIYKLLHGHDFFYVFFMN